MSFNRKPVSIVCVFNDPSVRQDCLDRSVEALRREGSDVDYIPVDNTTSEFVTAGAALNHGVGLARHEYVVFVHQDVYLHSAAALETAAGLLGGATGYGLLGACGISASGEIVGQIRDRIALLGRPLTRPHEVDSLDEVLFMAPRAVLLEHPLTETPQLAWHAYAVEYGLRMRSLGMRVGATRIPLTHNSLTTNLARLGEAHAAIARAYPHGVPVHTTCGRITGATAGAEGRGALLESSRWRYRWLKAGPRAHSLRRAAGGDVPVVLDDIRLSVDALIAAIPGPFHVVSLDADRTFPEGWASLELRRGGHPVVFGAGDLPALRELLGGRQDSDPLLVTGLSVSAVAELSRLPAAEGRIVGLHEDVGIWMLLGCPGDVVPLEWRGARATPIGMRPLGS